MMAEIKWKTREEIEREKNNPKLPGIDERLESLEKAMLELVLSGDRNG